ncbi:MAG TPA: SPOR domain-containing protein [Candidatus Omnitrophota bacterium]|nr:SPOR domain-containing protein [Candidatus Omnitrophota bacterium]HPB67873.1 SPOR domain-containing protein [Candidatus Omnitrophota bacterium]HQO58413.1 SPOR domain-containing protein [Candidatus Omnitrophota bacterium]
MKRVLPYGFRCVLPWGVLWVALCGFSPATLEDIETAVIERDYAEAKVLAQEFLDAGPGLAQKNEAMYFLGLSELFLGQPEKAREIFMRILNNSPDPHLQGRVLIGEIDAYFFQEKYEVALHKAEALLRDKPWGDLEALIYLKIARANLRLGRWEDSRRALDKIITTAPGSMEAMTARQLLEEKQFFSVQCGSFLQRGHAETLVAELRGRGEYAYIVETVDKDGTGFYRVRVGRFTTLPEAKNLKTKLADWGYPTLIYP